LIVGTRPEAIKLEPVAAALAGRGLSPALIFTGQHPQLRPADYRLDLYRAIALHCSGELDPHAHVGTVTKAIGPALRALSPALVVVQGDTSSALGGALAARLAGLPLAHVEAGLRSHNRRHPWPEEEFRVAIDAEADLLFAPTALSAANLRRECVRGAVHVTGNSGIDAVFARRTTAAGSRGDLPRLLVTCHRRENWHDRLDRIAAAVTAIAGQGLANVEVLLHTNAALAERLRDKLCGRSGVALRPACSHSAAIEAMLDCDLLLSDSGGMQEEATALGVPLLCLRESTERPEAIASGSVELVGTDPARIVAAVRRRLSSPSNACRTLPFGDGRAGERMAQIIEHWLEARSALSPALEPVSWELPRRAGQSDTSR
jgi:UDP-N-acetylglucosamine 2-epimerase (non-hydrolysing)